MKNRNLKGFTLIELIIVISIIVVLTAILVPTFIHYINESKLATANANAKQVYTATQTYCTNCKSAGYHVNNNNTLKTASFSLEWTGGNAPSYATNGQEEELKKAIIAIMGGQKGFAKVHVENSAPRAAAWAKESADHYVGIYPQEATEKISGNIGSYTFT